MYLLFQVIEVDEDDLKESFLRQHGQFQVPSGVSHFLGEDKRSFKANGGSKPQI